MKNFIALLLFSMALPWAGAQELHIHYNLHNDAVTYKKEGVVMAAPKLKQGDEIVLHLEEFNNYLYRAELEISQEHFAEHSGVTSDASLMSGLLPGFPTPGLTDFTGMGINGYADSTQTPRTSLLDIPLLTLNDNPITLSSLFGGSRGSEQLLEELASATSDVTAHLEKMDATANQIKQLRRTALVSQMANEYVEVLKKHPNLKPTLVKEMCRDYYRTIFRNDPADGIRLDDVLRLQDDAMRFGNLLSDLQTQQEKLSTKVNRLEVLARQYKSVGLDDASYRKYANNLTDFLEQSKDINQQLAGAVTDSLALRQYPTPKELANLQLELAEVIDNDFTHHSRFKVRGDRLAVNIKIVNNTTEGEGQGEVVKSRYLHYEAKGGLKITGSVGLNFSQYFDPAQTYSVNNGVIVGEDDGSFIPTVTSFLHFYSYSGKRVSLGGSFGIGFPLTNNGDNQSLQFFAGPSLIFGSSQRIILNFGLTGGRATRLARGYKVGDEFDVFAGDIPTRKPYEMGVFIGASFNLGGG